MTILFPIIIFFLNTSPALQQDSLNGTGLSESTIPSIQNKIYIVKQRWHTGIVLQRSLVDSTIWKEINHFKNFRYIDVGWGDEAFYQYPGFDLELAVKALFYPTPSTLRVEGFNLSIEQYADISDIVVELPISSEKLKDIYMYISSTYARNSNADVIIQIERYSGNIKFYKAKGEYHIFNTCNTWVAEALNKAGFDIPDDVILAEQLFNEVQNFGKVLKAEE